MGKILIVDDSSDIVDSLSDLLQESGYTVYSECNASAGYTTAELIIPDLILCDILMPKNDGYDFLKMVRSNKATSFIPVIFISARAERS
jgi:CheY-like chemotaxis protein